MKRKVSILILMLAISLGLGLTGTPSTAAPTSQAQATATPDGDFGGEGTPPPTGSIPAVDPAFSSKQAVGMDEYTAYWPHLAVSANANYSLTISLLWLKGQQRLMAQTSLNAGLSFSPTEVLASETRWGGSIGNLYVAGRNQGGFTACWYQLFGFAYPSIHCRTQPRFGPWHEEVQVQGSDRDRFKVGVVALDQYDSLHVLIGRGSKNLYYSSSPDGALWQEYTAMPITDTSHPNPTFLPATLILGQGHGAMLSVWGDARLDDGTWKLYSAYALADQRQGATGGWTTHYFTETDGQGVYLSGYGQYRPALAELRDGHAGLVFECRPTDSSSARDICYREFDPGLARTASGGWLSSTVVIAQTWPTSSEAPRIAVDPASGQRIVCWQDSFDNLMVVCSWSATGLAGQWSPPVRVNGGPHIREKMPDIAIAGGRLHVVWADNLGDERGMAIYYSSRLLPAPYPAVPTTATP